MMERIHNLKRDYGMRDYYRYFMQNNDIEISKGLYNKIITDYNQEIINLIIEDNYIYNIPHMSMQLYITKAKRKPRLKNGKLINNVPIDWKATNELWDNDLEAREKKLLVRYNNSHTSGYVFRIFLSKSKCKIPNKSYYKFKPNRKFQRQLSRRIKNPNKDNFDAFLTY